MKVKELIELLKTANQEAEVMISDHNENYKSVPVSFENLKHSLNYGGDYLHFEGNFCEEDEELSNGI